MRSLRTRRTPGAPPVHVRTLKRVDTYERYAMATRRYCLTYGICAAHGRSARMSRASTCFAMREYFARCACSGVRSSINRSPGTGNVSWQRCSLASRMKSWRVMPPGGGARCCCSTASSSTMSGSERSLTANTRRHAARRPLASHPATRRPQPHSTCSALSSCGAAALATTLAVLSAWQMSATAARTPLGGPPGRPSAQNSVSQSITSIAAARRCGQGGEAGWARVVRTKGWARVVGTKGWARVVRTK
eukprot:262222-Chlamydomonas_euryale.AAC.2